MVTEKDLFKLIKDSDEKAFEVLFRLYYRKLVDYCNAQLNDLDLAKGLIQQVFVNLWENRENLSSQNSPAPYLYRSAKNICLNYFRHKKVVNNYAQEKDNTDFGDEVMDCELDQRIIDLQKSIEKLPPQCKQIFIMSRLNGYKHKEIAEELGISIKTVKNQVGKALKFLKDDLSKTLTLLIICVIRFFIAVF